MEPAVSQDMLDTLGRVAPGTPLRAALDRVLDAGRGGLIVISDSEAVERICSGGFMVDSPFSPQKLAELSKMDGAIVMDGGATRIVRANVHLLPDPKVATSETGTRHRTAERVARSLRVPVVAVSESRSDIQIYLGDEVHPLLSASRLLERSNQAIQTLERYRSRLDLVTRNLTVLEVEDLVSVRDVLEVFQRAEMVVRISNEIKRNLVDLGTDGRLIRFQLEDMMHGVADDRRLLLRDYVDCSNATAAEQMHLLTDLEEDELYDDQQLASALGLVSEQVDLDELLSPKGYRVLSKLPRVTEPLVETLVNHYGSLAAILRADTGDIAQLDGVGADRAKALKDGTMRLVENSFFDRI